MTAIQAFWKSLQVVLWTGCFLFFYFVKPFNIGGCHYAIFKTRTYKEKDELLQIIQEVDSKSVGKVLLGDIFEISGSNLCQYASQEEVKSEV